MKTFLSIVLLALVAPSVMGTDFPFELPKTTNGDGGCYDVSVHKCSCTDDRCSKEKCEALCMIWTDTCPDHCDPDDCSECDPSQCTGEEAECEDGSGGGGGGGNSTSVGGACYDSSIHVCGCDDDRCSQELCEGLGMVWTSECSDHCDASKCGSDIPDDWYVTDTPGLGACYDLTSHQCGCGRFECTQEKCEAKNPLRFFWSTDCSISCDQETCPVDCAGMKNMLLPIARLIVDV